MNRQQPVNREAPFLLHELFFSKTDKRGVIQDGNSTFVRISGHPKEVLWGAPHNIIRHPDMPKAVFDLFWKTIQAERPIGAYVKNMAKDGSYYWVFACVWPIPDGYLSLRLKPSSPQLGAVQEIYKKVRDKEVTVGLEGARTLLLDTIRSLGFRRYEDFMAAALVGELESRDNLLQQNQGIDTRRSAAADPILKQVASNYAALFDSLIEARALAKRLHSQSEKVLGQFSSLGFISVNMAAASERIGTDGGAIAEVSNGFARVAAEIKDSMGVFREAILKSIESISASQFETAGARLQVDMITAFTDDGGSADDSKAMAQRLAPLVELATGSTNRVIEAMPKLQNLLEALVQDCEGLRNAISGLEVIRITGKIEVSQLESDARQGLLNHLEQMNRFSTEISDLILKLRTDALGLIELADKTRRLATVGRTQLGEVVFSKQ